MDIMNFQPPHRVAGCRELEIEAVLQFSSDQIRQY